MSDQKNNNVTKYKIVFIGDQAVGKTAILQRIIYDNFNQNSQPTVGIDFITKTINLDNRVVKLQLWDTAGQERFRSLIPSYVRDCKAVVCVFDLTNKNSLINLNKWMEFAREQRGEDINIFVLGNKNDLEDQLDFDQQIIDNLKTTFNFHSIYKVSAKTGDNISQVFSSITQILIEKDDEFANVKQEIPSVNYINSNVINNKGAKLGKTTDGYDRMNKNSCKC